MNTTAAIDRVFDWDATQLAAIERCTDMQQRIVPITGVAGTGKTTIIREVYKVLTAAGYMVAIAAPTGKAAKRIQEATGLPAMTCHRLLEYPHPGERDPKTGAAMISTVPKRDKENPLPYHVLLIDEYAMINREVHRNLIDALPPGGRICMFGDVNQLKPIEQGKGAMAESPFQAGLRRFDGIVLTTIHRQEEGSGVALNGERILAGRVPVRKDDFLLRITNQPIDVLMTHVMEMLDKGVNYGTNDGQIISPTKRSWVGTHKLNVALQDMLNPIGMSARMKVKRHTWDEKNPIFVGVGDKVIWTQNTYDLRNEWERYHNEDPAQGFLPPPAEKMIMNGESGVITAIDDEGGISIDVGDRVVEVPASMTVEDRRGNLVTVDPRRDMDLGFVVTTHKAQGSEWPHIIYVLNRSTMFIQSRHNFYTAISRARLTCTVITDQPSLQNSVFQVMSVAERSGK
jgi:exodeoxyribonuclease V alpha subunit